MKLAGVMALGLTAIGSALAVAYGLDLAFYIGKRWGARWGLMVMILEGVLVYVTTKALVRIGEEE